MDERAALNENKTLLSTAAVQLPPMVVRVR